MKNILPLVAFVIGCSKVTAPEPIKVVRSTLTITNSTNKPTNVFFAFGADSVVLPVDWPLCSATAKLNCSLTVQANSSLELPLSGDYLNASLSFDAPVSCGSTKAELNLNNPRWYDVADISLVDGYSKPIKIQIDDKTLGPVTSENGNQKAYGVYPLGCDVCVARQIPPCGIPLGNTECKSGSQYSPDVPCQHQGTVMGGGSKVTVYLLPTVN